MLRFRLSLSLSLSLLSLTPVARGQVPVVTIHDRVIADLGLPGFDIQEPALGVSRSRRLGAAQKPSAGGPMRAVLATSQSSSWTAQEVLPPGPAFHAVDASIALVDGPEQKFVLFGLNGAFSSGGRFATRRGLQHPRSLIGERPTRELRTTADPARLSFRTSPGCCAVLRTTFSCSSGPAAASATCARATE